MLRDEGLYAQNPEYDDYKEFKYIVMDLQEVPLGALIPGMSGKVNIGQVVLVNQAYEA